MGERKSVRRDAVTALTEPQRTAIHAAVAGIERDEITFFVVEADTYTLHLARRLSSAGSLVDVGTVATLQQLRQLIAYVDAYLAELYSAHGEG